MHSLESENPDNYVGFFRRLIAGVIDFTILLTTSIIIGMLAHSCFDGIVDQRLAQIEKLSYQQVNKRYAEVYGLPESQVQKFGNPIILETEFYGLENDRANDNLEGSTNVFDMFDPSKAVQHDIKGTDSKLAFPINTDPQIMSQEEQKFLEQYGKFIYAGNPIDRFRKAFPEFKHIPVYQLADVIRRSFFPGYKQSYEFDNVFGTYEGKIKTEDYNLYISILIVVYMINYFALSISSKFSATLGKMALGIKVLNADGSKMGLGKSFVYTICFLLFSIATFFTTFLPVLFNKNKQALHDRICRVALFLPS